MAVGLKFLRSSTMTKEEIKDETLRGMDELIELYNIQAVKIIESKKGSDRLVKDRLGLKHLNEDKLVIKQEII